MDTYVEVMVKSKGTPLMSVAKVAAIALTVVGVLLFMIGLWPGLILAVVFGALAYFATLQSNIEFEYLYVDKELTIDKIMAQSRRKRVETFDLERMEILAPVKSWRLDNYRNRTMKEIDYSSRVESKPDKRYVMYYNGEKKMIFEPSQEMVKAIHAGAPRKVFTD